MKWKDPEAEANVPSGLVHTWRLWRHCCCRYGWYPLLVAPAVTAGCLLSLYASGGCDFVRVQVGFTPSNLAWNQSTVELGLFHYQSGEPDLNKYRSVFFEGCRPYKDDFNEDFIVDDRTWNVARIMAYISGISSILATTMSWLFVISPLPAFFFWPGVLLPALMAAFLSEGSKFLFFDTSICRNTVWFPSGADSLPRVAESCELGNTGNYSIAGGAVFFLSLILVCLKAPEKRNLESDYGISYDREDIDLESVQYGPSEGSLGSADMYVSEERSFDEEGQPIGRAGTARDDGQEIHYTPRGTRRQPKDGEMDPAYVYDLSDRKGDFFSTTNIRDNEDHSSGDYSGDDGRDPTNQHKRQTSADFRDEADNLVMARMKTLDSAEDRNSGRPRERFEDEATDERYQPTKPQNLSVDTSDPRISESRVNTIEKMELNTTAESEDMIEKFVNDLNRSFQVEVAAEEARKRKEAAAAESPSMCQAICAPSTARSF